MKIKRHGTGVVPHGAQDMCLEALENLGQALLKEQQIYPERFQPEHFYVVKRHYIKLLEAQSEKYSFYSSICPLLELCSFSWCKSKQFPDGSNLSFNALIHFFQMVRRIKYYFQLWPNNSECVSPGPPSLSSEQIHCRFLPTPTHQQL